MNLKTLQFKKIKLKNFCFVKQDKEFYYYYYLHQISRKENLTTNAHRLRENTQKRRSNFEL